MQRVVDGACSLTGARHGGLTTLDDQGGLQDFITSGLTPPEHQRFLDLPGGPAFFAYLSRLPEPLRLADFSGYTRALGLPELDPPVGPVTTFLGAPIRHRDEHVGNLYLSDKEGGREFTREDEETLVLFASQAAMAIANARRYRNERRARADLETLINTSPVGVMVFDARTRSVVSHNREAGRIVGDLHMRGRSLEQLFDVLTLRRPDGREFSLVEFPLAQALSAGETVRAEEIVIEVPDGRSVTTLINATPLRSQEGELESVVVTLQDMTPLEELERLRAEFLGMVSHELRVPLTSIKGSADTLLDASADLDPAEMRQFFQIIRDQADFMRGLITDLLDVARIETGSLPVAPQPTQLAALVDDARSRFLSSEGRHAITIGLPPDLPPVLADHRRIVQVLTNLLANAARYSPAHSTIRVAAVRQGVHVAVTVTDEGQGVTPERLPHLFRKFARSDSKNRARHIEGTGLGLAICKGIVQAHGGRIWAESDGPGQGSRFTFTLPAVEPAEVDAATEAAHPAARPRPAAMQPARILVVDDDPQTLRYVRVTLTNEGYAPIVTSDPNEVRRLMAAHRPHLILLDLMLPGTDGIALMQRILATADVPVIFLSAYGQDQVIARAFDLGAADYVVKPFSPTELAARIRAALRRRAAPDQPEPTQPFQVRDLTIDYPRRAVALAGRTLRLTDIEYRLLVELALNAGQVVIYEQLLRRVWGLHSSGDLRPMRTALRKLRRKLGDDANNPTYIFTEPRVGYRLAAPETPTSPA